MSYEISGAATKNFLMCCSKIFLVHPSSIKKLIKWAEGEVELNNSSNKKLYSLIQNDNIEMKNVKYSGRLG